MIKLIYHNGAMRLWYNLKKCGKEETHGLRFCPGAGGARLHGTGSLRTRPGGGCGEADMQLNKIRMVLLRNHLESQAGSCTFEKKDPASGLNGFATITAILFNCITIGPEISWQLKVS